MTAQKIPVIKKNVPSQAVFVAPVPSVSGAGAAVLGKNRDTPPSTPRQYRSYRPYIRQATAQRLVSGYWAKEGENLRGSSVAGCGRWKVHGAAPVAQIVVEGGQARMSGHFICGCNWTCEMCARATVARNRSWLRGALFPALAEHGKSGSLVTLTLAHSYNVDWAVPVASLKAAYGLFDKRMSKVYKKAGSVGKFKAFEVTIGWNGIHPHFHILVTHDIDADLVAMEAAMRDAWYSAVTEVGGRCTHRGFDFQANRLNDYAAKMEAAHELSSQSTKQGRKNGKSLSQTLDAAGRGDLISGAEWQRAIKALGSTNRFNAGALAKNLGIPTPSEWESEQEEPEQGELVLEEPAPPVLIEYPLDDHMAATHPALGRPGLAMILRAAARSGKPGVLSMVRALKKEYLQCDAVRSLSCAGEPWAIEPEIIKIARTRPLLPHEVAEYLLVKSRAPVVDRMPEIGLGDIDFGDFDLDAATEFSCAGCPF
jgi:hypothetical protein